MSKTKPLYPHPDSGLPVLTNSMLTTYRRCPKQTDFKYYRRLKPRRLGGPLKRGKWVHSLAEEDARGKNWKKLHKKLSAKFDDLFDEEKEYYGDMPLEIGRIMRSYFWHYKHDPWKYHEVEFELEWTLPNGIILRGKVDALIENQWGLWLVDHKSNKTLPKLDYRMLDNQSPFYTYLALKNGIPVKGFIWNYIRWKAPTFPQLLQSGERLSKRAIETDYPTYRNALKDYGLDPDDYSDMLARLKAQRYQPDMAQTSPFFRRDVMEKQPDLVNRVVKAAMISADKMNSYDFSDPDLVERNVGRHCEWLCSYTDLCTMELLGGNTKPLIKQNYKVGDPMAYYHDREGDEEDRMSND